MDREVRAAVLREIGGALAVEEVAEPEGAVLDVRAAGVNFADVLIRRGDYPQPPELPFVPGSEVAGDLDGRRVIAFVRGSGGGYAERVAVDFDWVIDLPEHASYAEGAAFLLTTLTAWIPLTRQARVRPGSTVLVHAAAGGVGSAAVQVARHLGARVVATAGSEEKRRVALELGAEEAWSYEEFPDRVRADVVLDPVGGEIFARSLRVLEPLGAAVAIGYAGGLWQDVSPQLVVGRNISISGFYLGRLTQLRPQLVREAVGEVVELWRDGALKPLVGAEFPLERAGEALDHLESRRSVGKVVLVP
ncbi:MAG TPA: NADPH:quinone oxidoreductase family protein [Gaiellaceae bacterium]|nr:NADPH:quinone oxidoreductase family protein [Gaiellaceae bacterium]